MHTREVQDWAQEEERAERAEEGVVPACGQWALGRGGGEGGEEGGEGGGGVEGCA